MALRSVANRLRMPQSRLAHIARSLSTTMADTAKIALSPTEFRAFRVTHVERASHNTARLVFALPSADHEMGLTVASCLMAKATIDGEDVVRPYTPTNSTRDKGVLELVVKGYPTGKLSKHITGLQVGDSLEMKGPFVKFTYKPNTFTAGLGLVVGGSGITPAFQVLQEIVQDANDRTPVDLIFANNTEDDILLKDKLDAIAAEHAHIRVHYVLSQPPTNWSGHTGYVSRELLETLLPPASAGANVLIGVCGPPPMMEAISGNKNPDKTQGELRGLLQSLQYTPDQVFKF
jgi:cytochrome-b5 reductase